MKFKEILEMQKKLDSIIFEKANITEYPTDKIKLALLVELGELANEIQCFKYWKHNKTIDKLKALEEWADCFHFTLSLERALKKCGPEIFNMDFKEIVAIAQKEKTNHSKKLSLEEVFLFNYTDISDFTGMNIPEVLCIIDLGVTLGFTSSEMEKAYLKKYQKNLDRQKNNY